MRKSPAVGIDFGTSNTALALAPANGALRFAQHRLLGRESESFRSLLFFDPEEQTPREAIEYTAGPAAIEAYLDAEGEGRLIQSFKTHLTSGQMGRTHIGPHRLDLDDMVTLFLTRLRTQSEQSLGVGLDRVNIGRPVNFAGATDSAANTRAQERIQNAAIRAGFKDIRFEFEPIAAAYHYEQTTPNNQLALIADFGGGTTDYCIIRIGPEQRERADRSEDIIATGGVGIAGDDLDARLIEHVVSPQLGLGTFYREMGRRHEIPQSYYRKLCHWHQLSFLQGKETKAQLQRLCQHAEAPKSVQALMSLIDHNLGFYLHKSIEKTKIALSLHDEAEFFYRDEIAKFEIRAQVHRQDFQTWIAPEVTAIADSLDDTLARANLRAQDIDCVFLAGGTAFVPSVRAIFETRFGPQKLSGGDELVSIASGLALRARRQAWD